MNALIVGHIAIGFNPNVLYGLNNLWLKRVMKSNRAHFNGHFAYKLITDHLGYVVGVFLIKLKRRAKLLWWRYIRHGCLMR